MGGAEASIVDTNVDSTQVRMGLYPGEKRANVRLLGQVTLTVVKLEISISARSTQISKLSEANITFPTSPATVLESSSSFSSRLAQPTTLIPALIKSKHE